MTLKHILTSSALNGNAVQLSWSSRTGSNREIFSVEKSPDGVNFTFAGEQSAKGAGTFSYSFTDRSLSTAVAYYR